MTSSMLRNELHAMSSALANMKRERHDVQAAFDRYTKEHDT